MEPNGPSYMQFYDQTAGNINVNGYSPSSFQQSRMTASVNSNSNSVSASSPLPAPYGSPFRTENGMSRYLNNSDQFDLQSPNQQPQYPFPHPGPRRPEPNYHMMKDPQNFQGMTSNQTSSMAMGRDNYPSSSGYGPYFSSSAKSRMPQDDYGSSYGHGRQAMMQNFPGNPSRDLFRGPSPMNNFNQPRMGMQNAQMMQYPGFSGRPEYIRQQYMGQENPYGKPMPDSLNQAYSVVAAARRYEQQQQQQQFQQNPQAPGNRSPQLFGQSSPGFTTPPPGPGKLTDGQNESQRQAAMMAAAAVRAAAAASARQSRVEYGNPNAFPGPRVMSPQEVMAGGSFPSPGSGMQSPSAKEYPGMFPTNEPNMMRMTLRNPSPMPQGMPPRNNSNPVPYSPAAGSEQGYTSPSYAGNGPSYTPNASRSINSMTPQRGQQGQGFIGSPQSGAGTPDFRMSGSDTSSQGSRQSQIGQSFGNSEVSENTLNILSDLPSMEDVEAMIESVTKVAPGGQQPPEKSTKKANEVVKEEPEEKSPKDAAKDGNMDHDRKSVVSPNNRSSAPPTPLSCISGISPEPSPFHEELDFDNLSPSWPQTPTSPTSKRVLQSQSPSKFDQLSKLYEMSDDEERRNFLDKYLAFMSINGTPVTKVPVVAKKPLDLYKLCRAVIERGGLQEVMKRKQFREILRSLNFPSTNSSLAWIVKNQYTKYLLPYENKMKETLTKMWRTSDLSEIPLKPRRGHSNRDVPTIALNDTLPSSVKDTNKSLGQMPNNVYSRVPPTSSGPPPPYREWESFPMGTSAQSQFPGPPHMYMNQSTGGPLTGPMAPLPPGSTHSGSLGSVSVPGSCPPASVPPGYPQSSQSYGPAGQSPYGSQNDLSSGFSPGNFPGNFPRMMGRGPGQGFPMHQGPFPGQQGQQDSPMSPSWPRGMPSRPSPQGPPELFPEGLQRPHWISPQLPNINRSQGSQDFMSRDDSRFGGKPRPPVPGGPREKGETWAKGKHANIPLKTKPPVLTEEKHLDQKPVHLVKRESLTLPPDCIEATKPLMSKKKRLTSKDLGPVEAWRIMMSLKSGLLAECTWAIDTLNILLFDDQTISYFHLAQLPGLLDALMDHYRRTLIGLFRILSGSELPLQVAKELSSLPSSYSADDYHEGDEAKDQSSLVRNFPTGNKLLPSSRTRSSVTTRRNAQALNTSLSVGHKRRGIVNCSIPESLSSSKDDSSSKAKSFDEAVFDGLNDKGELLKELWVGVVKHAKLSFSAVVAASAFSEDRTPLKTGSSTWHSGGGDSTEHIQLSFPSFSSTNNHMSSTPSDGVNVENESMTSVSSASVASKSTTTSLQSTENTSSRTSMQSTETTLSNTTPQPNQGACVDGVSGAEIELMKTDNSNSPAAVPLTHNVEEPCNEFVKKEEEVVEEEDKDPPQAIENSSELESNEIKTQSSNEAADKCSSESSSEKSYSDEKLSGQTLVTESSKSVKIEEQETEKVTNLCDFEAMRVLYNEVDREDNCQPLIKRLRKDLELETEYDKQYLEESNNFILYLKNRLLHENRGKVVNQESVTRENHTFCTRTASRDHQIQRAVAVSNVVRSLSYISGNDSELANHPGLLLNTGTLLLYEHRHPLTDHSELRLAQEDMDRNMETPVNLSQDSLWEGTLALRENALVALANIAGQLDLSHYQESISLPVLDGLLHWLVCKSSEALDPLPTAPRSHALSPKRLAVETLAKLSITEGNVDLILATPPASRLNLVFEELVKGIGDKSCIPMREFCIVLLNNLAQGENVGPLIATQKSAVANALLFLEEAESNTSSYLSSGGVVQPGLSAEDICKTSVNMLRRAADILLCLARCPSNRIHFLPFTDRLLSLSTSQMMDTSVLSILADVMFELR